MGDNESRAASGGGVAELARKAKADSVKLAALPSEVRDGALRAVSEALLAGKEAIFAANAADMEAGERAALPGPILKRLKFDGAKLKEAVDGIADIVALPDPVSETLLHRELDAGLTLRQVTCPIGVIGVIFESRPDALIQIACLCVKSGNCAVLKGGSEAAATNRALFDVIRGAGLSAGLPEGFLTLVETRAGIDELLECDRYIDLIIPRGSNAFVRHIMERSAIPVMGHSDGVCHIYADKALDLEKAVAIITDAKIQYPAACNAVETLLVHREAAAALLPRLHEVFREKGARMRGCPETLLHIPVEAATDEDFGAEYLDYVIAVKVVGGIDEAIDHINARGSRHTDCIVTEDPAAAERFMLLVDSAGVYQNCSTRFADGFRYGFGAEVGISTGKLHARGPVGLKGLVTYKYRLYGDGHIVADYAEGRRAFKFREL
ncbi:MAG: glutamate-5-semialdehyde dehydrogenase [Clostridiales Family XIII bacterium]|jgi:glutamate-5-semialdehyde dehydrogenase|nr:glutamate-5-semialdehyde dehydrogenase [Clostridiales Family XIII bacterium]